MLPLDQYILSFNIQHGIGEILRRAAMDYNLYLYLVNIFGEEYIKLKSYSKTKDGIVFHDNRGRWLIIEEYYLYLFNNDKLRLKELLSEYGDYLVVEFLANYDDIFQYPDKSFQEVLGKEVSNEMKTLVTSMIGEKLSKEKEYLNRKRGLNQTGILNTLNGNEVRPQNDTYYIDDFR